MSFVHHCVFCSWHRDARCATLLEPACERCGCPLTSTPREEYQAQALYTASERAHDALPSYRWLGAVLRWAGVVLLVAVATRAGYEEGGVAMALVGLGAAGLLAVPAMVPAR